MTNQILAHLSSLKPGQKYRLGLFGILSLSSLISIGLFTARATYSDSIRYAFLVWNLFLAWVPFGLAWIVYTSHQLKRIARILLAGGSAFLWLLFFPNSPYILTDFVHLRYVNYEAPIWYDVIMLLWFAFCGLFLGLISLFLMQRIVETRLGARAGWLFVVTVTILSSLGVYLGRFLRLNSWDVFFNPLRMTDKLVNSMLLAQERTLAFSLLFSLFFLFVYVTMYLFALLINDRSPADN